MLDFLDLDEEVDNNIDNIIEKVSKQISRLPYPEYLLRYPYDMNLRRKITKYHLGGFYSEKNIGNINEEPLSIEKDLRLHDFYCRDLILKNTDMKETIIHNVRAENIYLNNSTSKILIISKTIIEDDLVMEGFEGLDYIAIVNTVINGTWDIRKLYTEYVYHLNLSYGKLKINNPGHKTEVDSNPDDIEFSVDKFIKNNNL